MEGTPRNSWLALLAFSAREICSGKPTQTRATTRTTNGAGSRAARKVTMKFVVRSTMIA